LKRRIIDRICRIVLDNIELWYNYGEGIGWGKRWSGGRDRVGEGMEWRNGWSRGRDEVGVLSLL